MQPVWVSLGDYDSVLAARPLLNLDDPMTENKGLLFGKGERGSKFLIDEKWRTEMQNVNLPRDELVR